MQSSWQPDHQQGGRTTSGSDRALNGSYIGDDRIAMQAAAVDFDKATVQVERLRSKLFLQRMQMDALKSQSFGALDQLLEN